MTNVAHSSHIYSDAITLHIAKILMMSASQLAINIDSLDCKQKSKDTLNEFTVYRKFLGLSI